MLFKHSFFMRVLLLCTILPVIIYADPVIFIDPDAIDYDLVSGEIAEQTINIMNEGDEILSFTITRDIIDFPEISLDTRGLRCVEEMLRPTAPLRVAPLRDDPGFVLREIEAPYSRNYGLAWDAENEWLWAASNSRSSMLYALQTADGEVQREFDLNHQVFSMFMHDGILYTGAFTGMDSIWTILRYDTEGNAMNPINSPFWFSYLAGNDDFIFLNPISDPEEIIYVFSIEDMNDIAAIDYGRAVNGDRIGAFEWVDDHAEGQLWLAGERQIYQCFVDENWNCILVQEFETDVLPEAGMAHDGLNLWRGSEDQTIYMIDDGVRESSWILFSPDAGELNPGEDSDVFITLNAENCIEGNYEADLHISSNDPEQPDVVVNVIMHVVGIPDIAVEWSVEAGYPQIMDWNLVFEDLFTGSSYDIEIVIHNTGTADLDVDGIHSDNGLFRAEPDNLVISPHESAGVTITLDAQRSGLHEGIMYFDWNSPDEEDLLIPMRGESNLPPDVEINPMMIEEDLLTGEVSEHVIVVSNDGDALLRMELDHELIEMPGRDASKRKLRSVEKRQNTGPRRDDLGEILAEYEIGEDGWLGMAWDGELMWGITVNELRLVGFDPDQQQIVETFNLGSQYAGLAFDGEAFWTSDVNRNNSLVQIDRAGDIIRRIELQGFFVPGVAFDGDNIWFCGTEINAGAASIVQMNLDGEILREIPCEGLMQGLYFTLEWVNDHRDGQLWAVSWEERRLYQLDVSEQDPEIVQMTDLVPSDLYGLGHDGDNLWYCQFSNIWRVIDDGIQEARWLSYQPDHFLLEPDAEQDINLTLDAANCVEGEYEADLHFRSNDPEDPDVAVNVLLYVTGVPILEVEWAEEAGYPDEINWNLAHLDLFTAFEYTVPIVVRNSGTAEVIIEAITFNNEIFSSDQDQLNLEPFEEATINLSLDAVEDGIFDSEMIFDWNSPVDENFVVRLTAQTSGPPSIFVSPNAIEHDLQSGEAVEQPLNISNEGDSVLRFRIEHELIREPERDAGQNQDQANGGPARDNTGDVIQTFFVGEANWTGLAWDGEFMWGTNINRQVMVAFDPESNEIVNTVNLGRQHYGLTFDGEAFWAGHFDERQMSARIVRFDREGVVLRTLDVPGSVTLGVSFDGENLWYYSADFEGNDYLIRQITVDGEELRALDCSNIFIDLWLSIEIVPAHNNGELWVLSWDHATLYHADISEDRINVVEEVRVNRSQQYSLAHDGENLWYASSNGNWYMIDDGIVEANWLSYNDEPNTVDPGNDIDIFIALNTEGCMDGDYEADLHIRSNDPANGDEIVSVQMHCEMLDVATGSIPPGDFKLSDAFPNPFNGVTRFTCDVPRESDLSIQVYDVAGHLVETLFAGRTNAGTHAFVWDSRGKAAGIYLIKMAASDFTALNRIVLLK